MLKIISVALLGIAFGVTPALTQAGSVVAPTPEQDRSPRAQAGPCTDEIDRFEAAVQTAGAGHQLPSARLDRQPSPASVEKARRDEIAEREHHQQIMQRARAADANGDRAGCLKALDEARHDRWTKERSPARLRYQSQ